MAKHHSQLQWCAALYTCLRRHPPTHTYLHRTRPAGAGKTVRELQFRDQFNGVVVAISRQGERIQVGRRVGSAGWGGRGQTTGGYSKHTAHIQCGEFVSGSAMSSHSDFLASGDVLLLVTGAALLTQSACLFRSCRLTLATFPSRPATSCCWTPAQVSASATPTPPTLRWCQRSITATRPGGQQQQLSAIQQGTLPAEVHAALFSLAACRARQASLHPTRQPTALAAPCPPGLQVPPHLHRPGLRNHGIRAVCS